MRVCIPTEDDSGLDALVSEHFGSAHSFTIVDMETGRIEVRRNAGRRHEHGICEPLGRLDPGEFDVVICRGLGRRALAALRQAGKSVFVTEIREVSRILAAARRGELSLLPDEEACCGGGPGRSLRARGDANDALPAGKPDGRHSGPAPGAGPPFRSPGR